MLFSKVIHQVSRSHGTKLPNLTSTDRFRIAIPVSIDWWLLNIAQTICTLEQVPSGFWRSSIKFLGHTGRQINDLDRDWVRLLCQPQLLIRSHLPSYEVNRFFSSQDRLLTKRRKCNHCNMCLLLIQQLAWFTTVPYTYFTNVLSDGYRWQMIKPFGFCSSKGLCL